MCKLDNKVVIITGATGGVGAAASALFSQQGAKLVLTGRDEARLREAASKCDPERTRAIVSDNSDPASLDRVVALAVDTFGGLDAAFLNAGNSGKIAPFAQLSLEDFDDVFRMNVRGTFAMMQKVVGPITARGGGSIVVTSSTSALVSVPMCSTYGATKSALVGLVRGAAVDLAAANIRVNALVPGGIDNAMIRHFITSMGAPPEYVEPALAQGAAAVPMKRFAKNEEIAKAALFLVSDESSYSTGSTLVVDGGLTIM